jgi:hypothetical protein
MSARPWLAPLRWFARHLVAFGFLAFVLIGWVWREEIFAGRVDWRGLLDAEIGSSPAVELRPDPSIPKAAFRPVVPGLNQSVAELEQESRLLQARRAYWLDDHAAAERLYREHLADYPADVDGHGELGNLLLMMGRAVEARTAYLEAVRLLEKSGRNLAAARLRDALAARPGLAGEPADEQ